MRLTYAVLSIGLLLTGAALAKDDPGMLVRSDLYDPAGFLPPPPAAGSPAAAAELAEVKRKMAEATPAEMAEARSDNDNENGTIFAGALGPAWDLSKLPATAKLIDDVTGSESAFSDIAKGEFHRDRPWVVDSTIRTCAPSKPSQDHASYPSGHATVGFAMGIVLAHLMPEHAGAILARSQRFAENRLVCGFHFRSDIVAGQEFGTILALRLMQNARFQQEMTASSAELKRAGLSR